MMYYSGWGMYRLKEALPNCDMQSGSGRFRHSLPSASTTFKLLDKNDDGKLSKEEIPEGFRARLMRVDDNSDGAITKEELEAHSETLPG